MKISKDQYIGIRVSIVTEFDRIKHKLKVDIKTCEDITPKEICYSLRIMIDDWNLEVMEYNYIKQWKCYEKSDII